MQKLKNILNFLKSRLFLKNFGLAIGIFLGILVLVFLSLKIYTRHGQAFSVPDFYGQTIDELKTNTARLNLRFQVTDSVYLQDAPKGAVVEQNPPPGFKVKKNRNIFFTVNAVNPETVMMPNIVGVSLRQAQAILQTAGLQVGKLSYVPDIAMNYVLGQKFKGRDIEPGEDIIKGSSIDIILGNGLSNEKTAIPNLAGLNLERAKQRVFESYLNFGAVIYDNTIENDEDSINAKVWRQRPTYSQNASINLGSSVDVWLTVSDSKIPGSDTTQFIYDELNYDDL